MINHVFISYSDGFPVYFIAANTKIRFLGRGLISHGDRVLLLNKYYSKNNIAQLHGFEEGIEYVSFQKNGGKVKSSIVNTLKTFKFLKKEKRVCNLNVVYIGCGNFFLLAPIAIYARLLKYKVAFIYEEFQAGLDLPLLYRINGFLHSYILGYFVDFILPISEFLVEKSQRFNKPIFKLPICADFSNITHEEGKRSEEKYFLYCASAIYKKAFEFVIDAYLSAFGKNSSVKLHMVLSGRSDYIEEDKDYINQKGLTDAIIVRTQLPYEILMSEYANAAGLLIPLFRNNIMDVARFSQKISEYLSTSRPVLSTDVGEITYYFKNKENMYIASQDDSICFGEIMKYVIDHPDEAEIVGKNGFEFGKKNFDYRAITDSLSRFLYILED